MVMAGFYLVHSETLREVRRAAVILTGGAAMLSGLVGAFLFYSWDGVLGVGFLLLVFVLLVAFFRIRPSGR